MDDRSMDDRSMDDRSMMGTTMNDEPRVTIILLSLLRKQATMRCIESIFAHTTAPFEIIIVDMGQSAEIVAWLEELGADRPNVRVVFNAENVGTTKGRNQAIGLAQGKYIVFLDNDTEATAGWLEPLLAPVESDQTIAACGAKVISPAGTVMNCAEFVKAEIRADRVVEIGVEFATDFQSEDPVVNQAREVPWYPATCLLVRKSDLDLVGPFDENIFLCEEDKDLCLRLRAAGKTIHYVPASTVYHHHDATPGEYTRIRNNMPVLMQDINYFQEKWHCKVFIRHTRTYLHRHGMDDPQIDRIQHFSFFNTILEEELRLSELIVTVTNRCNHTCGFCYYHDHLNKAADELTIDEYRQVAATLGKLNILWISGGEPFLRKNLPEICRVFVEANQVDHVFIPTNGSRPDRIVEFTGQILAQNPGIRFTLMFSLEGTAELHDKIHGRPGAFAAVEESIRRVNFLRVRLLKQQRTFGILLNSVVTTQNIEQMPALLEYARNNLRVDSHSLSPMRSQGWDSAQQPPSGNDLLTLYERAKPYFAFYAQQSKLPATAANGYLDWLNRRYTLWSDVLEGGGLPFDCQAGNLIGVLEPDGGVRLCEAKPVVANVRDYGYSFPRAWFSAQADKNRLTVKGCTCTHACFLSVSENYAMKNRKRAQQRDAE